MIAMHHSRVFKLFLMMVLTLPVFLSAKAPQNSGTVFLMPQNFKFHNRGWALATSKQGAIIRSGEQVISGLNSLPGVAAGSFEIKKAGTYFVWVYLGDMVFGLENSFTVKIRNGKQELISKTFRTAQEGSVEGEALSSMEPIQEEQKPKWFGLEVSLPAAKLTFELAKNGKIPAVNVAGICITQTPSKVPPKFDSVAPYLFVRARLPKEAQIPLLVSGGGRTGDWKTRFNLPHPLGRPIEKKGGNIEYQKLEPGEASPWMNLSQASNFLKAWLHFDFGASRGKNETRPGSVILEFSTTPDESGIFKTCPVSGQNVKVRTMMSIGERDIVTDMDIALESAKKAESLPPPKGKRPVKFPVATAIVVFDLSDELIDRELKTVASLGFNSYGLGTGEQSFFQHGKRYGFNFLDSQKFGGMGKSIKKCGSRLDPEVSKEKAKEFATLLKENNALDKVPFASLADEPSMGFGHLTECQECLDGFAEYLKEQKVTPAELGVASFEGLKPLRYGEGKDALHYWSMRYYCRVFGMRFKTITQALKEQGIRSGVNFACQIAGNVLWDGANWFEFYRDGTLTYGWTEDWFNMCRSYEFCGFQMAVMRAACKPAGTPYGTYCIIGNRTPWDIGAKSFTQLGRKLDSFKIFNYGPYYSSADSFNGREPELFEAVRDVIFAIGAVEDSYLKSQPIQGDAAMLYSTTSDIWNSWKKGWFPSSLPGLERSTLYILLSRCGVRTDILHESDLGSKLKDYKVLFVTDNAIRSEYAPIISQWVKDGGTLYLGADALSIDHYKRPLSLSKELNLKRDAFQLQSIPGILEGGMPPPVGKVPVGSDAVSVLYGRQNVHGDSVIASFDDGTAAIALQKVGKGKVILCGFFPGLTAFKTAGRKPKVRFQSLSVYPKASIELMQKVVEQAGIHPVVKPSDHMIDAQLLTAPDRDILVLANWGGEPAKTEIRIAGKKYKSAKAVRSGEVTVRNEGGDSILTLTVPSGDFVECFQ